MSDRGPARRGASGPGPGPKGLLLLVVAVGLGIVLLQDLDTAPTGGSAPPPPTTTVDPLLVEPLPAPPTTEVVASRPLGEVKVLVVNAAMTNGLANTKTTELVTAGFGVLKAQTAINGIKKPTSEVQYVDDYSAEAQTVARVLNLPSSAVIAFSSPPAASVEGANVIVVLGADADPTAGGTSTTAG